MSVGFCSCVPFSMSPKGLGQNFSQLAAEANIVEPTKLNERVCICGVLRHRAGFGRMHFSAC